MKNVITNVLGNLHLNPGVNVHVVTRAGLDGSGKDVVVSIKFIGRQKESDIITFEERIPAKEICINAERLYEALAGVGERSSKVVENLAAREIAEKGVLRILGVSGDREGNIWIDLTFHLHILQIEVPYTELEGLVK